jgi:hypothetical protein
MTEIRIIISGEATQIEQAAGDLEITPVTEMVKRSYYLPAALADELTAFVNDLHFDARRPKHEALEAILRAGMEHKAEITKALKVRGKG